MTLANGIFLQERYEILNKIGSGGMSEVYKAKDHKLNRLVAIKVLKEEFCSDMEFVSKFNLEAQQAAGLSDANIVNVYDVIDEGNIHYIVMELIEGVTLKEYIQLKGKLDIDEAIGISIQIAQGISAAHKRHIVHRDIKPQNVIISNDGQVKVADFGIARAVSAQTMSGLAVGSVHYISPEQAKGLQSDERSDIYSFGISLYEMVTGRLPYEGDSTVSIALAHLDDVMVPPSVYNDKVPKSLENIIFKCTKKNREDRYDDIQDVIQDLNKVLAGVEISVINTDDISSDAIDDSTKQIGKSDINTINMRHSKNIKNANKKKTKDGKYDATSGINKIMTIIGIIVAAVMVAVLVFAMSRISGLFNISQETDATADSTSISEKQVVVPDVLGLDQNDASSKLKQSDLYMKSVGTEYSDTVPKDAIISQEPKAGEVTDRYSNIRVVISLGETLNDLTSLGLQGMEADSAKTLLEQNGYKVNISEEYSDTIEEGKVSSYSPTSVAQNGTVTLNISKGIDGVAVPLIAGHTLDDAMAMIEAAGLKVGTITPIVNSNVAVGTVVSQVQAADSTVSKDSLIDFSVSAESAESVPSPTADTTTNFSTVGETIIAPTASGKHTYVAAIDTTYDLTDLIGPGSSNTSVSITVRLKQTVNGQTVYKTLMEPRKVTADTLLPIRFKSIEGAYGVDTGTVEVVEAGSDAVLKSYSVEFFPVG